MAKRKGVSRQPSKHEEESFTFLGARIAGISWEAFKKDIIFLIILSIIIKIAILILSKSVSFIDLFDISYYHNKYVIQIFSGKIPYVDFSVDYPQFFILPLIITNLLSFVIRDFTTSYMILAAAADCVVVALVYMVALNINKEKAYTATFLYATAFGSAYFVLTKYDVFPTTLLMLSLVYILYEKEFRSYLSSVAGFLMKFYPLVVLPFYAVYNMKHNRFSIGWLARALGMGALIIAIFSVPNFNTFIYTYTVNFGWTHPMSHGFVYYINYITGSELFTGISSLLIGVIIAALLAWYYKSERKDARMLVGVSTLAVFSLMMFNNIASPQYCVWVVPLFAIFLASSIYEAGLFYAFNLITYADFPFGYNVLYDNVQGYYGTGAFILFTIKFVILFVIAYIIFRKTSA